MFILRKRLFYPPTRIAHAKVVIATVCGPCKVGMLEKFGHDFKHDLNISERGVLGKVLNNFIIKVPVSVK